MDLTPNLKLPYLAAAQSQKHVTVNESLRGLDAIVQVGIVSRTLTAPPATPANGDRYIVPAAATGAWSGSTGRIAAWQDGAWAFYVPSTGWLAWVGAESALVVWNGTTWAAASSSGASVNPTPLVGVNATADTTNRLAVASPATLFNHAGAGHQLKLNKAAAGNTASVLLQNGFSGRAELGLTGDDDMHFKVSADGTTWKDALIIDRTTGKVSLPFNEAWTTYTPAVSAGAGSLGSFPPTATGAYYDVGSMRFFDVLVSFPANYTTGSPTASAFIGISVPSAPVSNMNNGMGREIAVIGTMMTCLGFTGNSVVRVMRLPDLAFVAGNSYVLHLQFSFRTA